MTMVAVLTATSLALVALVLAAAADRSRYSVPRVTRPTNPVDHAERILASRYARGVITSEEYERMLAVLRR